MHSRSNTELSSKRIHSPSENPGRSSRSRGARQVIISLKLIPSSRTDRSLIKFTPGGVSAGVRRNRRRVKSGGREEGEGVETRGGGARRREKRKAKVRQKGERRERRGGRRRLLFIFDAADVQPTSTPALRVLSPLSSFPGFAPERERTNSRINLSAARRTSPRPSGPSHIPIF